MNALNFFTREDFNDLKDKYKNEIEFPDITREVKENGNTYQISVHGSRYVVWDKAYFISFYEMHNYKMKIDNHPYGIEYDRCVGGGDMAVDIEKSDNYEEFIEQVNKSLSRYPDYRQEYEQLSLF